jgi:hypothetical protein
LHDLARLANGVINGQQPVQLYGGLPIKFGRAAVQQCAESPDPEFLAGEFVRRIGGTLGVA